MAEGTGYTETQKKVNKRAVNYPKLPPLHGKKMSFLTWEKGKKGKKINPAIIIKNLLQEL